MTIHDILKENGWEYQSKESSSFMVIKFYIKEGLVLMVIGNKYIKTC